MEYINRMGTVGGERIWGIRSMDDVVIASTYKAGDDESQERAVERLDQ